MRQIASCHPLTPLKPHKSGQIQSSSPTAHHHHHPQNSQPKFPACCSCLLRLLHSWICNIFSRMASEWIRCLSPATWQEVNFLAHGRWYCMKQNRPFSWHMHRFKKNSLSQQMMFFLQLNSLKHTKTRSHVARLWIPGPSWTFQAHLYTRASNALPGGSGTVAHRAARPPTDLSGTLLQETNMSHLPSPVKPEVSLCFSGVFQGCQNL